MRRLIEEIMNNNYVSADELFRTGMSELVEHIVLESKKIVASQMVEEKKNDHDYDDPPFDPDKKKSTPWKNPHSKAKHLAREMMKKYKKKEDLKEDQLDEISSELRRRYIRRAGNDLKKIRKEMDATKKMKTGRVKADVQDALEDKHEKRIRGITRAVRKEHPSIFLDNDKD